MPAPFEFGKQVGNDPMAAVNAKRVADMKAMAAKVRDASGTPNPTGDGTHRWSGRVMPGGNVQGAQYTPPSTPAQPQQRQTSQAAAFAKRQAPQQKQLTWDDEEAWDQDVDSSRVVHTPASAAAAAQTRNRFNSLNASAGGAGRAGMATPPPAQRPAAPPRPQRQPALQQTSYAPPRPNVTTTKVDTAALQQQMKQMQAQPKAPPAPSTASAWSNQTNNPAAPNPPPPAGPTLSSRLSGAWNAFRNPPPPPQAGPLSAPMSNTSTAFNNATGQQDPPHIITTDNGRKFNTQTKTFLDGRPGGFAR